MLSYLLAKTPAVLTLLASAGVLIAEATDGVAIGSGSAVTIGLVVIIAGAVMYVTRENTMLKNAVAASAARDNLQDSRMDKADEKIDLLYEDYIRRGPTDATH